VCHFRLVVHGKRMSQQFKTIYFIRHCEKPEDARDENLSLQGTEHAKSIGLYFVEEKIRPDVAYCCTPSTLLSDHRISGTSNRPYQTVEIIMSTIRKLDLSPTTITEVDPPLVKTEASWVAENTDGVVSIILHHHHHFKTTLVVWEHHHLPMIARGLGFNVHGWSSDLNSQTDEDSYNIMWVGKLDLLDATRNSLEAYQLP
jgi:hypothetical protein